MDTYHRKCQLDASRRRLEDAETLHKQKRWMGAIYLGGYAVECALKSLICYEQRKNHFKETTVFQKIQGASLHNLTNLLNELESIKRSIQLDRSGIYKPAWNFLTGDKAAKQLVS
jgi:HEPN domain-containing protein